MKNKSFGEMWATLTEEQREYFAKYIDRQRKNAVEIYIEQQCNIGYVSGMLLLTKNAKKKLEYINGSCISQDFPKEQPTLEWAGAVLDLLEELKLGNYR